MKATLLALCLLSPAALACDAHQLPLSGTITVPACPQESPGCVYAGDLLHRYMEAVPEPEEVLTIGLHTSPWRMYDGQWRIITVDDLATTLRPQLTGKVERIELIGSWSGVSPAAGMPSLADRLSKALGGYPVKGEDGFLWLAKDGSRRTTHQAFTGREGGAYFVPKDGEVMVSLAGGWPVYVEGQAGEDEPELLMRIAAGWDLFLLCPQKALAGYEHAAKQGSAIAAYNAAIMRLERNDAGDRDAALALLERGVALGDGPSRARLASERARQ